MIEVGQKMRFVPHYDVSEKDGKRAIKAKSVTGVVTMVNAKHRVFWCEYDHYGSKQLEAFKFQDIGDRVRRA